MAFEVQWCEPFKTMLKEYFQLNLSFCMLRKDTDEIMGIRVMNILKRTDATFTTEYISDVRLAAVLTFMHQMDEETSIFDRLDVDEAINFFILCVSRKYRRRGVASRLQQVAIALCRELGFKGIIGAGSSAFSQKIYEKEGFKTLLTMPYDMYKTHTGLTIKEKTEVHTCRKFYVVKL